MMWWMMMLRNNNHGLVVALTTIFFGIYLRLREGNGIKQTRWQSFVLAIACFTSGPRRFLLLVRFSPFLVFSILTPFWCWAEVMNMKMMECQPWFQLKTFRLRQHWLVVPEKRWFFQSRFCGDEWWQIWVEYGLDLWVELPKFPNVTSALSNKLRKAYLATSGLKHGRHVLFWRTDYGFWHSLKIEALHWLWGPNVAFCSHNRCAFSHVFLCFISGLETARLFGVTRSHTLTPDVHAVARRLIFQPRSLELKTQKTPSLWTSTGVSWNNNATTWMQVNERAHVSRQVFTWVTQQASDFQRHQAYFTTFGFWHAQLSSSKLSITKNWKPFDIFQ